MKVLVATARTQGKRSSDVMNCVEGELVTLVDACPDSRARPFGACACGITFLGTVTDESTTTAEVRDLKLTRRDLVGFIAASYEEKQQCTCCIDPRRMADELIALASAIPEGAVVERLLDDVTVRP